MSSPPPENTSRPTSFPVHEELDTSIQADPPYDRPCPPEEAEGSPERNAGSLLGTAREEAGEDEIRWLEEPVAPESLPTQKKRKRHKKGRRKRRADSASSAWRYYLGAIGPFGWSLIGLTGFWLGSLILALAFPGFFTVLMVLGNGLVLIGNLWIGFIAFRDNHTYGMLCFFTCLFTYVYIFMNLEETWRPASLTALGFLIMLSAVVVPGVSAAPHSMP